MTQALKADEYKKIVNRRLDELIPQRYTSYAKLYDAMRYSLLFGGKRMRPLLSAAVFEMLDEDFVQGLDLACAIEMIHSYSLIHDDLPAMDDDDLRRGRPTNHIVYGEAMAVLAGDGLLNKAAEILFASALKKDVGITDRCAAALFILEAAGPDGMIAGQVLDLQSTGENISADDLRLMHSQKTGKLIGASLCYPALFCARNDVLPVLKELAGIIGLSFQIKDDILDVEGDPDLLGKRTGRDDKENKSTYVSVMGLDEAKKLLYMETEKAFNLLESFGPETALLKYMIDMVSTRQS